MTATWLTLSLLYKWLAAGGRNADRILTRSLDGLYTRYYTKNGRKITCVDVFKREKFFKVNAIFT